MKRGFVLGGWWPFPGWLARPWERSEREELGTACPALALLPWAFTWLIPIPQQPQRSQELPIAQEMKGVLWEDLGMAGTQRELLLAHPPLRCRWHSQNVYLYSDTFKQMSHQWDPFPAPIWLQTVN